MPRDPEQLLKIKQAAELLNVSEISLRRWTNDGRLACVRVGGRRERRFRRQDLLDFLENLDPRAADDAVLVGGVPVGLGAHLCGLYDSDLGRLRLAVPFLSEGLRRGDTCFLVAARAARDAIRTALPRDAPAKQLILAAGEKTGAAMYDYLERAFVDAVSAGARVIRLLGDMVWTQAKQIRPGDVIAFETRVDQSLLKRFPVVAVCQYDAREFSGLTLLSALKCHSDMFRQPLARFLG
jgi:excisionase family DNA binding protein